MTGRDSYKGVPQKAHVLWDGAGLSSTALDTGHDFMVVGSGALTAGKALISDASIGYQTMVFLTTASGTGTTATAADITFTVNPTAKTVTLWGTSASDTRRFNYFLINPGFGTAR